MFKTSIFKVFLLAICSTTLLFTTTITEAKSATGLKYRFSPSANQCFSSTTKEYKRLSKNRVYKTLNECQKKIKKGKGKVLGAFERKGGANTTVNLEIKESK